MFDPLGAVTKIRKTLDEEEDDLLGAAPITITQGDQLEKQNVENYSYIPDLGDVPEMDVPLALPDLPGMGFLKLRFAILVLACERDTNSGVTLHDI